MENLFKKYCLLLNFFFFEKIDLKLIEKFIFLNKLFYFGNSQGNDTNGGILTVYTSVIKMHMKKDGNV